MKLVGLLLIGNLAFAQLPHTDGKGLLEKPEPYSKEAGKTLFEEGTQLCDSNCVSDFGTLLGESRGVKAYSNCKSRCIRPEFSFLDLTTGEVSIHKKDPKDENLHYIGLVYQCVEYARRWWMINKNITFGSIDSAHEIIYLTEGENIRTNKTFPLARSINGTAKKPPQVGDLIVYYPDRSNLLWRHGHVAVAVDVNLQQGWVAVAEENYDNKTWLQPDQYSRKISLFSINGYYTLLDIAPGKSSNPTGGLISGWVHPLENTNEQE